MFWKIIRRKDNKEFMPTLMKYDYRNGKLIYLEATSIHSVGGEYESLTVNFSSRKQKEKFEENYIVEGIENV